MEKEDIKNIIESQGVQSYFSEIKHHSAIAKTPGTAYVSVLCKRKIRMLGRLDTIAQMSESDLLRLIAKKLEPQVAKVAQ